MSDKLRDSFLLVTGCLVFTVGLGAYAGTFGQNAEPTARARIEEIGQSVRVWTTSKKSGGPVTVGALLRDGDEVQVSGAAKFAWLDGGSISFRDPKGGGMVEIGLPAGKEESVTRFAPLFFRWATGAVDLLIPARQGTEGKFEISTNTTAVSTKGAKFTLEINDRASATVVRVEEGEVDLVPQNSQLKPSVLKAGQAVEVNKIAVIYQGSSMTRPSADNSNSQSSASDPYFIFALQLYNYDELYLGTEASLRDRTRCSFGGGGHCLPQDRVAYQKLAGPFSSVSEARKAVCQSIGERKTFEDAVLKGKWRESGAWYSLMGETLSFDCPRETAPGSAARPIPLAMKSILFLGIVAMLGFGFVVIRRLANGRKS